ncbi:MAG TPA: MFS transporter [Pseudomonas sabulinigri]|uniref:Major facilitator superfamily (MFS) profile domain-containing protein n=1 Tax=marine sediment metagenome TaxID=412755 RepID=A0A0F9VI13_9ZZZZ|nr:MFS transporter [Halopseudomonas sabulinigri]HEC53419.1 MFS transporter [Halopseudomonas sabulinigri]
MIKFLVPIGALLTGIALLLLGTGLLNTLLALRGSAEGFADQTLGLLGSAYFAGFILGTWLCPRLIRRMGHVRAFTFLAAAEAACVLIHVLWVNPGMWLLLRVVTGVALVGIYTVIESWLNTTAPPERRGQIFACYMAVNLGSLALAQQLLRWDSPMAFTLFAVAAILIMVAVMPVSATRLVQPVISDTPALSLKRLWQAAPVACAGAVLSGLGMGGFWGLGAVYAGRMGMDTGQIAGFVSLVIVAGALSQWPMGRLSDQIDRRKALVVICGIAAGGGLLMALLAPFGQWLLVAAAVFGAGSFAVYPAVVAHLIDHLHQEDILSGNAALLMLHGLGAAIGPALAGWLMSMTSPIALPLFFTLMFTLSALYALWQLRQGRDRIVDEAAHYIPMVRTSNAVLEMMLEDATHEGHDEERAEAGNSEGGGSEPSGTDESTAPPLDADAQQPATDDEEQQPGRN